MYALYIREVNANFLTSGMLRESKLSVKWSEKWYWYGFPRWKSIDQRSWLPAWPTYAMLVKGKNSNGHNSWTPWPTTTQLFMLLQLLALRWTEKPGPECCGFEQPQLCNPKACHRQTLQLTSDRWGLSLDRPSGPRRDRDTHLDIGRKSGQPKVHLW